MAAVENELERAMDRRGYRAVEEEKRRKRRDFDGSGRNFMMVGEVNRTLGEGFRRE